MEENKEKMLENFIKKVINEAGLEETSDNFTDLILSKVQSEKQKSSTGYKTLKTRPVWSFLAVIVVGIIAYVFLGNIDMEINWASTTILKKLKEFNFFAKIPQLSISDIYVYGFLGLAIFVGIQVSFLKRHFNNRVDLGV